MKPVWSKKGEQELAVTLEWTWKTFCRNFSCLPKGPVAAMGRVTQFGLPDRLDLLSHCLGQKQIQV